jgi:hypothetical protein
LHARIIDQKVISVPDGDQGKKTIPAALCKKRNTQGRIMKTILFSALALLAPAAANAHVKWFSDYSFNHAPLQWANLNHPTFWFLFGLSLISLPLLVWVDRLGEKSMVYGKINGFLDQYSDSGGLIMRVALGAVLLMSWQGDSVIAPEIKVFSAFWGWFQYVLAILLLFKRTVPFAGLGIIILYLLGLSEHGFFHMLDYVIYPAVGLFLILTNLKDERLKNLDLPVLYTGLGFSLCWVAFEKIFYPHWGLSVLSQAPVLTMGLPHDFFLLACAFIEFTLGYLLIICLLQRPLAIIITLVFFITTSFFGKTELIGHTILHGALLVFVVKGHGHRYLAPIRFHRSIWMRNAFAIVNFVILFAVMALPYQKMSQAVHARALEEREKHAHPKFEVPAGIPAPVIQLQAHKDPSGGWNFRVQSQNFTFSPMNSGKADVMGEGHGHLYVNGEKVGRVYGEWFHLNLPKGNSVVKVTLNTNEHKDYYHQGEMIQAEVAVEEARDVIAAHHH